MNVAGIGVLVSRHGGRSSKSQAAACRPGDADGGFGDVQGVADWKFACVGSFLFLNHHGPQVYPPMNGGLPFGPHPHKGFETLTFVFEGEVAHSDSTGQTFVTGAGVSNG